MMGIYYFARPNQMIGHKFTDDVAVAYAMSKGSAIKKFSVLYKNVKGNEVKKISFWNRAIVLTDY
jgi:hypothetical protein